jgi:site-specific recombinase XerD
MLPQIVLDWLERLRQDGKSRQTIQAYRQGIQHFLAWYATLYPSDFDPDQVMPRDIRDWQARQQRIEQSAPATINQRLVAVKRFFKWAQKQQIIQQNPADDITTIRINQREIKSLEATPLRRLLRAAKANTRDYAILEVLVGTGIRVGELLQLKVGDLDMQPRSGN